MNKKAAYSKCVNVMEKKEEDFKISFYSGEFGEEKHQWIYVRF